jgi:hypothetical protein
MVFETFHEMETEEQITMILAELYDDVNEAIEVYEKAHLVDRDGLLELATIAQAGRADLLGQAHAQLIDDLSRSPERSRSRSYLWRSPFHENTLLAGAQSVQKSMGSVMTTRPEPG